MDSPGRVSMVKATPLPPRLQVVRMLAQHVHTIEERARLVATNIAVPAGIPIDVLALDADGGLVVIDVFDGRDPSWLVHLMHHLKWIDDNYDEVRIAVGGLPLTKPARVRGAGVVARMTAPSVHALGLMGSMPIRCFKVRCFTTGSERFLALEPHGQGAARVAEPVATTHERAPVLAAEPPVSIQPVDLTGEEIADFLDGVALDPGGASSKAAVKSPGRRSAL